MQACSFDLLYNPKVVEVVSATKGSSLSSSPIINPSALGKIVFSYASTTATTSSATLMNVQFRIKDNANYGESAVTLNVKDLSDGSFAPIENTVKNGKVTVLAPKLEAPFDFETVSLASNSARILWSAVDEATGYNVYLNGSRVNDLTIGDNMYSLEGLEADTDYTIQVTTMNYTVESEKSAEYVIHTEKETYSVLFLFPDYDAKGEIVSYSEAYKFVKHGEDVEEPEIPEISGYAFVSWDKPLTNITEPVVITALYEATGYRVGDVNLDKQVNIRDVTAIQRHISELEILTGDALIAADTNGDGVVDINDATHLQRYLAEYEVILGKQS